MPSLKARRVMMLMAKSNRMRGETPKAVARRKTVTLKLPSAWSRTCSASWLALA